MSAVHERIFSTIYKDTKQKHEVRKIRFLGSDVAVVHADGTVVKKSEDFAEKPQVAPLLIFAKQNGKWQITVFQNLIYLEAARKRICGEAAGQ